MIISKFKYESINNVRKRKFKRLFYLEGGRKKAYVTVLECGNTKASYYSGLKRSSSYFSIAPFRHTSEEINKLSLYSYGFKLHFNNHQRIMSKFSHIIGGFRK